MISVFSVLHAEPAPAIPEPAERVIRVGIEVNGEPLSYLDRFGTPTGFAIELFDAVARSQHIRFQYVALNWSDVLAEFKAGRIDMLANVADTPERRTYFDFSIPTLRMEGAIYQRKGTAPIRTIDDMAGRRVSVLSGALAEEYLRDRRFPCEVVHSSSLQSSLDAVHSGNADALLATLLTTQYMIGRSGYTDVQIAEMHLPDFVYNLHFGVHKGDTALLARLNDGLYELNRSGAYDVLHEKWVGPLEPRTVRWRDARNYVYGAIIALLLITMAFLWQRRVLGQVKRNVEDLRRSEERLQLVFESTQDGFWDWDVQNGTITRSPRWTGMLGYRLEEVPPTPDAFRTLVHPDDLIVLETADKNSHTGTDYFQFEFRMRTRNGDWIWVLNRGKVVARNPVTLQPLRIAGTHTDITARKLAEEEAARFQIKVMEAQKLESLGVLAGGIAHDFNNLLTVILGSSALVRLEPSLSSENAARIEKTIAAAQHAANLCRQLLAYAGHGAYTAERIDLNALAQDTARLLQLSLGHARLEFALMSGLPPVEGDPSQLRQMFTNLTLNAAEAIGEEGGVIRITTSLISIGAAGLPHAQPSGNLPAGDYICLEIADTGAGMDAAVQARIFDPFYSTKFTGRGLGLAAVLGIVRGMRGALTVSSAPGQGAVFRIHLPVARPVAHAVPPRQTAILVASEDATFPILIADDDQPVRELLALMLRKLGHQPLAVADGVEAVEAFTADPDRFRLVLCDITMPRLDGLAALDKIHALRPGVPTILLTGHSEQDTRERLGNLPGVVFLQKPFTFETLRECMRQAVGIQSRPN